jgi:glycosyltransferase involved in cell wall biosynthesis
MKILQINKYHFLKGGADSVFFNTEKLLQEHGHTVIPFCIHHPDNIPSEFDEYFVDAPEIRDLNGWEKVRSIPRFFFNQDAARKVEMLILKEKPDIAHVHNIFNGISLSVLPVLHRYHIPVVISMHETRFICPSSYFNLRGKLCDNCRKSLFLNCALHKCYQDNLHISIISAFEMIHKDFFFHYDKYISQYIFLNKHYEDMHAARHQYFKDKGVILYNMLPALNSIRPVMEKGDYLFYYGRITSEKGITTLIEAMKSLPDVKLIVAGKGTLLDNLKQIASANVQFVGFVKGKALDDYIDNASFIVVPSECEENNPMTVIEAYAHGKPVIGSRIGGIPEIIREGETGFIFQAFDKDDLIRTINKANSVSEADYMLFSNNSRNFADINFNPDKHYEKLMEIYKRSIITKA